MKTVRGPFGCSSLFQAGTDTFPNGLVLVAENMPGVQSAAFTLLLPAGAAYEGADGLNLGVARPRWQRNGFRAGQGRATAANS